MINVGKKENIQTLFLQKTQTTKGDMSMVCLGQVIPASVQYKLWEMVKPVPVATPNPTSVKRYVRLSHGVRLPSGHVTQFETRSEADKFRRHLARWVKNGVWS